MMSIRVPGESGQKETHSPTLLLRMKLNHHYSLILSLSTFLVIQGFYSFYIAPLDPIMIRTSEEYRADSIAVIIEWTQWEDASYNITIIPMVPMIHTGSTSVQLIASYNTEYSVSLEASTVCQSIGSSNITLFYGKSLDK